MADHVEDTDDAIDEDWIDWLVDLAVDGFIGTLVLLMVVAWIVLLVSLVLNLVRHDVLAAGGDALGVVLWVGVIVLRRSRKGRA